MKVEICIDSLDQALAAEACGAHRLELCSNLLEGGTTPGFGMTRAITQQCSLPVYNMIRPRPGHFTYSAEELHIMLLEIEASAKAGAKGVVFGILNPDNTLNLDRTEKLVNTAHAHGLKVTFHRAIDVCTNVVEAIDALADMGVENILTSGQAKSAMQGLENLTRMAKQAAGRIHIMAGGGINPGNAATLVQTGVHALHCTARRVLTPNDAFGFGEVWEPDFEKIRGVVRVV